MFSKFNVAIRLRRFANNEIANIKEEASVLANGPSLKDIISHKKEILNSTDLMVMNFFSNTEFFFTLKPRYYIILDSCFFFVEDKGHTVSEKPQKDILDKFIVNVLNVDWRMVFFIPASKYAVTMIDTFKKNPNIQIVEYNATRIKGFKNIQYWMIKNGLGIPSSINVLIPALIQMLNVGYKKIYLYGAEFSWLKSMNVDYDNGMLYLNDRHFYSNEEIRYFKRGGYKQYLYGTYDAICAMEDIDKYSKRLSAKIINRTKGSFIDVFEYENPDNIDVQ